MTRKIEKTDAEWRAQLDPMQFQVARKAATDALQRARERSDLAR